jgi:hypothetical protein
MTNCLIHFYTMLGMQRSDFPDIVSSKLLRLFSGRALVAINR